MKSSILLDVTEAAIAHSKAMIAAGLSRTNHCPLAIAGRVFTNGELCEVAGGRIRVGDKSITYNLSSRAIAFVARFDDNRPVRPGRFRATRPQGGDA